MTSDILTLSVPAIMGHYRRKTFSPVDVAEAVFGQVEKLNPKLNAFALLADRKEFLQQARLSEDRWMKREPQGPFDGIPVTIKDGADVAGWPTREGSATTAATPAQKDSFPAARLRTVGAIFLGKTTLPEFGHKAVTDSPAFGITRNPWNPAKTCGGSSGGAGVAAATRMGFLHHGSDGGGSIRIPASFCGVFGFKPTTGIVPSSPPTLFSTLSSAGSLTRSVEEGAIMLDAIADGDGYAYAEALSRGAGRYLRIAYASTINDTPVQPEVAAFVAAAAKKAQKAGTVEPISLKIPALVDTFNKHWLAIAAWLLKQIPAEKHSQMDPYFVEWGRIGASMPLDDYLNAELERLKIIDYIVKDLFSKYDLLIMPTMAMTAFDVGNNVANDLQGRPWRDWTPFTFPANLAKLPAASLPCGVTAEGLPVGLQILAAPFNDSLVLNLAHVLEREIGFQGWLTRFSR